MDINKYIDNYIKWLRSEITTRKVGKYYEITAPFLDSDNDYIQIYVKLDNGQFLFSDDCYTLNRLIAMGITMSGQRKKRISQLLNLYGSSLNGNEIVASCPESDFPQAKHMFIQSLLRVGDLYLTARPRSQSLFTDDVNDFFDSNGIYNTPNILFKGKTGFSHNYDFLIQRTKKMPERLISAMNTGTQSNMNNILFSWDDTKKVRPEGSELIVMVNDQNSVQDGVLDGFHNYDVKTILWSQRENENNKELLSA